MKKENIYRILNKGTLGQPDLNKTSNLPADLFEVDLMETNILKKEVTSKDWKASLVSMSKLNYVGRRLKKPGKSISKLLIPNKIIRNERV